ncbi:MAG: ATP-binding cassette domain-containing protein [Thaumarchaeota archaeon]|nr:ATP-binding cassette domain-containing protein [Nitrososphaerota archaeon]
MGYLVHIEKLSFRYLESKQWTLSEIELEVKEGEIIILAGPSGCGKSTLLRCMNGLIPHMYPGDYQGSVTIDGIQVREEPMGILAQKVGLLFQNPENQIFMFSVERDIAFGPENLALPRQEIRSRVDETMRLLGIEPLAQRAPHELSDGQKQRVALAGVIAMRPKLVILDEPTSLLDPKTASELVSLIQDLNTRLGITFVVVEHRLDLLTKLATRMVVMNEGRKVLDGTPSEVLSNERVGAYGIVVPSATRLYSELAKEGVKLARVPLAPSELTEQLRRIRR